MKSPWVTLAAVLIVGLAVGAAIAGRPTSIPNNIRVVAVASTTSTIAASTTAAVAPTTTEAARPATTTTAVRAVTTTTKATTTTIGATTTAAATTSTTPGPDRGTVVVLVVNAANASGIARAEAARLVTLGYRNPLTGDATERITQTTVYARAGHEAEALVLLADVGYAGDRLRPMPTKSITTSALETRADVILALGVDWGV